MSATTPATRSLDLLNLPYQLFEHSSPPVSLEDAASQRRQRPDQVIRSILFKYQKQDYFLVLVAGPGQISWRKLRQHLALSRISMASEQEVLKVTGYAVGAVTPLGLRIPLRILVDTSVVKPREISLGSGVRGLAIIIKPSVLMSAIGKYELGDFAEAER
jgi:Cys-tRNA(Pro)/Cys-tRNA(Cys) deacylase